MASLEGFKEHAVLDGEFADQQLQLYLDAAMGYLKESEVAAPSLSEARAMPLAASLYDLAAYQIATHYCERRGMVGDNPSAEVFGVQGIIHQLKGKFTGGD